MVTCVQGHPQGTVYYRRPCLKGEKKKKQNKRFLVPKSSHTLYGGLATLCSHPHQQGEEMCNAQGNGTVGVWKRQ